jgi:predicted nucleotidyltransferase
MMDLNTIQAVRVFLNRIKRQYKINDAILFGSRARQTHRADSDADVAVLLPGPAGEFLTTKLAMADIAYDILLETGIRIQPFPLWEEEWRHPETYSNPGLLQNIKHEGIYL